MTRLGPPTQVAGIAGLFTVLSEELAAAEPHQIGVTVAAVAILAFSRNLGGDRRRVGAWLCRLGERLQRADPTASPPPPAAPARPEEDDYPWPR